MSIIRLLGREVTTHCVIEHSGGYVVLAQIPEGQVILYKIYWVDVKGFVSLFPISHCSPLSIIVRACCNHVLTAEKKFLKA